MQKVMLGEDEVNDIVVGDAVIGGVMVTVKDFNNMTKGEVARYIDKLNFEKSKNDSLVSITLSSSKENPGNVVLDYKMKPRDFERIRRITGYLVGNLDRFNNGKRAEERDRVKHAIDGVTPSKPSFHQAKAQQGFGMGM